MNRYHLPLVGAMFVLVMSSSLSMANAFDTTGCNQVFPAEQLRVGYSYTFWDDYTNNNTYKHGVSGFPSVVVAEQYDYNRSTSFPAFGWDAALVGQGYEINPKQTIRAITATSKYSVIDRPPVRSPDNLVLRYTINFDAQNGVGGGWTGPYTHVECQPYEITWCGDGQSNEYYIDTKGTPNIDDDVKVMYETCDDGAQNGQPGKCNITCKDTVPNNPPPTNGVCGPTSGTNVSSTPTTGLCSVGVPSIVSGSGPWSWSCGGTNGGVSSPTCTANPSPVNGVCGPTSGTVVASIPSSGLCSVGVPSPVSGSGPWSWSCGGTNGGSNSACTATPPLPQNFMLSVKKYIDGIDAQDDQTPVIKNVGDTFNYTIIVKNEGPASTKGKTTITDDLPFYIGLTGTVNGVGWDCSASTTIRVVCTSTSSISAGASFPTITIPVQVRTGATGTIRNIAVVTTDSPSGSTKPGVDRDPATIQIPSNGVCSGVYSGSISTTLSAITPGICAIGTPVNFISAGTSPILYSWSCTGINGGNNSPSCNANHTPAPTNFAVSVKKYVDTVDAQDATTAVVKNVGDTFDYIIRARNEGPASTNGVTTITDVLPTGVVLNNPPPPSGTGWTCTGTTTIVCTTSAVIPANTNFPDVTIPVKVTATSGTITNIVSINNPGGGTPTGPTTDPGVIVVAPTPSCGTVSGVQSAPISATTAYLCSTGTVVNFSSVGTNPVAYTWNCTNGVKTSNQCTASYTPPVGAGFNLSLKKYVNNVTTDAQPGSPVPIVVGSTVNYIIRVTNNGPASTSGTSTVSDTLPAGVALAGNPAGTGWSCNAVSPVVCTSTTIVAAGASYSDITIPVTVTATTVGQVISNIATVTNGGDTTPGDNTDPADLIVSTSTPSCGAVTGVQPSAIDATKVGLCAAGNVVNFSSILLGSTTSYTWNCMTGVTSSNQCRASYTPSVPLPVCVPGSTVGAQSSPVTSTTPGLCPTGKAVGDFSVSTTGVGSPSVYVWSCGGSQAGGSCTANHLPGSGFALSLKKFVDSADAQPGFPVTKNVGDTFNYVIRVTNNGPTATSGTSTVTDTLPSQVDLINNNTISSLPWNCTLTLPRTISCTSSAVILSGQSYPDITIPVKLNSSATVGSTVINTATVTNPDEINTTGNGTTGPGTTDNTDPAVITVGSTNFALSLKKYVNGSDAQTVGSGVVLSTGSGFDYTIIATNNGPASTSGTTTVTDTLPTGVAPDTTKTISAPGWSCNGVTSSASVSCQRSDVIVSGASYPTITIPAKLTATSGTVTNIAIVSTNSSIGSTVPNQDRDPAVIIVATPVVPAACEKLVPDNAGAILAPNVDVTYTCSATGTTIVAANLEYSIKCETLDTSIESGYTGSKTRVCRTPAMPSTPQVITCTVRDKTNPTVIFPEFTAGACKVEKTTSGNGGSSSTIYYAPSCTNGFSTCSQLVDQTQALCNIKNPGKTCYTNQTQCEANALVCSGPGGPSPGTSGSPGTGRCGDGILQSGEECDVKNATWCGQEGQVNAVGVSIACKLLINTNPGDNPFTELWMTIPQLSPNRIGGYSQLNGGRKIPFKDNKLVIGVGTSPFSIADTVVFGMKTAEPLPVIVEADKKICLISTGAGLNNRTDVCTTFGEHSTGLKTFMNGTKTYVIIGNGYYQVRDAVTGNYNQYTLAGNPDYITLFQGSKSYPTSGAKFYKAFEGLSTGIGVAVPDSILSLEHYSSTTGQPIDLVGLPVRISGAMVGASSATVNRKLESYINSSSLVNAFLSGFTAITTTTTNTTTATSTTSTATNTINVNTTVSGNTTVSTLAQMEALAVNGNKNILSLKNGNLTIDCVSGVTATMLDGVRTVLVENGDLILNCNNGYGSSDISSSWAWIVKNGNIRVATGVTNMAGVYVALGTSTSTTATPCGGTGNICAVGNVATNAILRINGSLYGNADPLFQTRLYVRGTNAYDILTTGVILSYSNRALVSPPPLLSQFLNNYSVTRVVK